MTGRLNDAQLWDLTQRHFGDLGPQMVSTMFGIAKAESGGISAIRNLNPQTRDDSWGLWQINVRPDANPRYASWDLTNPELNAQAAREILDAWGGVPTAWSTYSGGQYRQHITPGEGEPPEMLGGRELPALPQGEPALPYQSQWDPRLTEQAIRLAEGRQPVYMGNVAGPGPGAYDMSAWGPQPQQSRPEPALPPPEVMIPLLRQARTIWGGALPSSISALYPGV